MLQRYSSGWRADLLALLAGATTPLAFAPLGWWPLAMLGPALLFTLWLFADVRGASRRGGLFGIGFFGVGISWVFVSIHYHGYVSLPLSLFLTVLLVLVMALFPALLGYLIARFFPSRFEKRYTRLKLLLVMPAAWVLVEWVRGWFMTGFPWISLGYSQTDTLLAGWAAWLGVFGRCAECGAAGGAAAGPERSSLLLPGAAWHLGAGVADATGLLDRAARRPC